MRQLLLYALFMAPYMAWSQQETIDLAVSQLGKGQTEEAIATLRQVIKNPDLTEAQRLRTCYNLSDALLRDLNRMRTKLKGDLAPSYKGYIFEASDLIVEARNLLPSDPALTVPIKEQVRKLKHELTLNTLDNIRELEGTGDPTLALALVNSTELGSRHLIALDSNYYLAYDYLGQALMLKGDSLHALRVFEQGLHKYTSTPQPEPDAYAGYMVYRMAVVQLNSLKDPALAEKSLADGLIMLDSEIESLKGNKNFTEVRRKLVTDKINKTRNDLIKLLLDVKMLKPDLTEDELKLFTEAMANEPKNINIRLAYAKVLNRTDPDAAIDQYAELAAMAPNDFMVLFNLGAMYVNKASRTSQTDPTNRNEVSRCLNKALEWLIKAEAIDPNNKQLWSALAQVYENLGQPGKAKSYRSKL